MFDRDAWPTFDLTAIAGGAATVGAFLASFNDIIVFLVGLLTIVLLVIRIRIATRKRETDEGKRGNDPAGGDSGRGFS